jgi:hypothetical protein
MKPYLPIIKDVVIIMLAIFLLVYAAKDESVRRVIGYTIIMTLGFIAYIYDFKQISP